MSADVDNIICLCAEHHMNGRWNASKKDFNWHGSPAEAMDWFTLNHPDLHQRLKIRSQQKIKPDLRYWQDKLKELQEMEAQFELGIKPEPPTPPTTTISFIHGETNKILDETLTT